MKKNLERITSGKTVARQSTSLFKIIRTPSSFNIFLVSAKVMIKFAIKQDQNLPDIFYFVLSHIYLSICKIVCAKTVNCVRTICNV